MCGSENYSVVHSYSAIQFFTDDDLVSKRVDLNECLCEGCNLLYKNPSYTKKGFEILFAQCGASYGATKGRQSEQLGWLEERQLLTPGSRILDVGCYDGLFLSELPTSLVRMGVDIDKPSVDRGNARDLGLRLTCGSLEKFLPPEPPDVMVMFHVLEHVENPVKVLKRLKEVSSEGAVLVVEVPIAEFGGTNDINGFFSVQHLTHFTKNTLRQTMRLAGWEITEGKRIDGYNGYRVVCKHANPITTSNIKKSEDDLNSLRKILAKINEVQTEISEKINLLPYSGDFIIWGGGIHTELMFHLTKLFNEPNRRFHIIDGDHLKIGRKWRGIPISSSAKIKDINWAQSDIRLILSTYGNQPEMEEIALKNGVSRDQIIKIYSEMYIY